jgi:hypothetical protein
MGIICLWGAPKPVDPNIVKFLFLVQLENYCLDLLGNTIVEILIFLLTLNCRMVQNHSKVFTMLDNTVSTYLFLSKSGLYVNDRCVLYPPIVESTMNSCMEPFSWNSPIVHFMRAHQPALLPFVHGHHEFMLGMNIRICPHYKIYCTKLLENMNASEKEK